MRTLSLCTSSLMQMECIWYKAMAVFYDHGAYKSSGCIKKHLQTRPDKVEEIVFNAMKERLQNLVIAKTENRNPDTEPENIKAQIIRIDNEICKLMIYYNRKEYTRLC